MKYILFVISAVFCLSAGAQTTAPLPWQDGQFHTASGAACANCKVCTYVAGTSTALATYTDQTGTVSNNVPPNAIILDSTGRSNIWLTLGRSYKINLLTAGSDNTCNTGTLLVSKDNLSARVQYSGTAAPVSGTYQTSDFVWNSSPTSTIGSASAVLGWLCTAGGTPGTWVAVGPTPIGNLPSASISGAFTPYTTANYISSETGSNNAIAGALTDIGSNNVTLAAGLCVTVKLAHTLQAGADTFSLNAVSKNIKSHFNIANNIGTAYAATGFWSGCYDGTEWLDSSE